jgi:hypothetical protein
MGPVVVYSHMQAVGLVNDITGLLPLRELPPEGLGPPLPRGRPSCERLYDVEFVYHFS